LGEGDHEKRKLIRKGKRLVANPPVEGPLKRSQREKSSKASYKQPQKPKCTVPKRH